MSGVGPERTAIREFYGWANEEQPQTSQGSQGVSELLPLLLKKYIKNKFHVDNS